ncbi:uncharacterized protein LOC135383781 [Ornithodoros turicata]|uniref:uncharacterized protein LOC135383781 n=1 Tax=Ornithodoros turicata TaxID=34597 RepID=UPI003138DE82
MAYLETSGLFSRWLNLSSSVLALLVTSEAPSLSLATDSSRGGLLLSILGGQPRVLALLLAGLVYTALMPIAAVALLVFRRRVESRLQDVTQRGNFAWYAYSVALSIIVITGIVTALTAYHSRSIFTEALIAAPENWKSNLVAVQQFVNSTGKQLSDVKREAAAVRLKYATHVLDTNFTDLFQQSLADAVAKDLNVTTNCSTAIRTLGRRLQREGLRGLGGALIDAAEWCTHLENGRNDLLRSTAEKVDNSTKRLRSHVLEKLRAQTSSPDTYLADVKKALMGLDRAKQRAQAALCSSDNGLLGMLARAALRHGGLLEALNICILAALAVAAIVNVALRHAGAPLTERGLLSHVSGVSLTIMTWPLLFFCFVGTPMALGILLVDVGMQCHVCYPYRQQNWSKLDAFASALWPREERGDTFDYLTPTFLATRCGSVMSNASSPPGSPPAQTPILKHAVGLIDIDSDIPSWNDEQSGFSKQVGSLLQSSLSYTWLPLSVRHDVSSLLTEFSNPDTVARQTPKAYQGVLRAFLSRYYSDYMKGATIRITKSSQEARLKYGACNVLRGGFEISLSSLCGPLQKGLTGYWFALSLNILRYTAAVALCLGISKFLLRMKSDTCQGTADVENWRIINWAERLPQKDLSARIDHRDHVGRRRSRKKHVNRSGGDLERIWMAHHQEPDGTRLPVKVLPSEFVLPERIAKKWLREESAPDRAQKQAASRSPKNRIPQRERSMPRQWSSAKHKSPRKDYGSSRERSVTKNDSSTKHRGVTWDRIPAPGHLHTRNAEGWAPQRERFWPSEESSLEERPSSPFRSPYGFSEGFSETDLRTRMQQFNKEQLPWR